MHDMNSPQNPSRGRCRKALELLAVVGGAYGAYQMVQQLRALRQQSARSTSLTPAGITWSPSAGNVMSPPASPSLGEHALWLETFRTEQVRRLRSDPPAA